MNNLDCEQWPDSLKRFRAFSKAATEVRNSHIKERLEFLRLAIRASYISYEQLSELQGLAEHIAPNDVELLEWAGVPEFPEDEN